MLRTARGARDPVEAALAQRGAKRESFALKISGTTGIARSMNATEAFAGAVGPPPRPAVPALEVSPPETNLPSVKWP